MGHFSTLCQLWSPVSRNWPMRLVLCLVRVHHIFVMLHVIRTQCCLSAFLQCCICESIEAWNTRWRGDLQARRSKKTYKIQRKARVIIEDCPYSRGKGDYTPAVCWLAGWKVSINHHMVSHDTCMVFMWYTHVDCLEHKLAKYMLPNQDKRA